MNGVLLTSLAALAMFTNFLDNWTTYRCLYKPFEDFTVIEVNPVARFLFDTIGLDYGLLLEFTITVGVIGYVTKTTMLPDWVKGTILVVVGLPAAFAAWNNYQVMQMVGVGWFF